MSNIPQADKEKQGLYLSGNIPPEILSSAKLTLAEKLIYGLVAGFKDGTFMLNNLSIGKSICLGEKQVSRSVANLVSVGILKSERIGSSKRLLKVAPPLMSMDIEVPLHPQECLGKGTPMSRHINRNNNLNNNSKKKEQAPEVHFPIELNEAQESWNNWMAYRKQIKKPLTQMSQESNLKKWAVVGSKRLIAAVEHSISSGYQGLYEPSSQNGASNKITTFQKTLNNLNDLGFGNLSKTKLIGD